MHREPHSYGDGAAGHIRILTSALSCRLPLSCDEVGVGSSDAQRSSPDLGPSDGEPCPPPRAEAPTFAAASSNDLEGVEPPGEHHEEPFLHDRSFAFMVRERTDHSVSSILAAERWRGTTPRSHLGSPSYMAREKTDRSVGSLAAGSWTERSGGELGTGTCMVRESTDHSVGSAYGPQRFRRNSTPRALGSNAAMFRESTENSGLSLLACRTQRTGSPELRREGTIGSLWTERTEASAWPLLSTRVDSTAADTKDSEELLAHSARHESSKESPSTDALSPHAAKNVSVEPRASVSVEPRAASRSSVERPVWFAMLAKPWMQKTILVWWLWCFVYGSLSVMPYFGLVGWDALINVSPFAPGKIAMRKLYEYFPQTALFCNIGLLNLTCDTKSKTCTDLARKLLEKVPAMLDRGGGKYGTYVFDSQYTTVFMDSVHAQASPQRFVTPDGRSQIFTVCASWPTGELSYDILQILDAHNPDPAQLKTGLTSSALLADDGISAVKRDLPMIDCVCIPLAFAVMGVVLRSARFLIIAFTNLAITIMTTFAVLYLICHAFSKVPDATQVNFVTIIALGLNFDYSLFLLFRFKSSYSKATTLSKRHQSNDHTSITVRVVESAVLYTLQSMSPVVLSSGLTLTVAFCGLLFLSSGNLVMAGMGCAVATVVCMIVALTAVPSMLLMFPVFFSEGLPQPAVDCNTQVDQEDPHGGDTINWHSLNKEEADAIRNSWHVALWRQISTWPYNLLVVIALHVVAIYCGLPVARLRLNNDVAEIAPRASTGYQTLQELGRLSRSSVTADASEVDGFFGFVGYADEVIVVIEASEPPIPTTTTTSARPSLRRLFSHWGGGEAEVVPVDAHDRKAVLNQAGRSSDGHGHPDDENTQQPVSPEKGESDGISNSSSRAALRQCGYSLTAELSRRLLRLPEDALGFRISPSAIFAPGWARGQVIDATEAEAWHKGLFADAGPAAEMRAVDYFADTTRRCGGDCFIESWEGGPAATLVSVLLPVNLASADGDRFITEARAMLKDFESEELSCEGKKLSFYLADAQSAVVNHDLMRQTFAEFRRVLPVEIILIFAIVGIVIRSAFVPLRLAMTVVLPICSVYGLAVKVYQDGILQRLGWSSVAPSADESFHWEVPIFALALTMALALDYDLFIVIRIADYRFAGYTMQGSILRALHEHGPVVTGAGLMMAISFGSNLFAEATTLNQAGWILGTGVLVDVFVVRTLLVPALLSFSDKAAWWPSVPPTVGLLDEFGHVDHNANHIGCPTYEQLNEQCGCCVGSPGRAPCSHECTKSTAA